MVVTLMQSKELNLCDLQGPYSFTDISILVSIGSHQIMFLAEIFAAVPSSDYMCASKRKEIGGFLRVGIRKQLFDLR